MGKQLVSAAHPTPARLWLFRLGLVLAAPAVFFLGLEGALRLVGYGRDTRFFIPDEQPGFVRTNPDYTALFLPGSFDLRPLHYRVALKKPAGTVCTGAPWDDTCVNVTLSSRSA